jgi:hypothetical protein
MDADEALIRAYNLGMADAGWTDDVMDKADVARLVEVVLKTGTRAVGRTATSPSRDARPEPAEVSA